MLRKYSKYAVAAAIAGTCGYASAATISASATNSAPYSVEGAATGTNPVAAADVTFSKNLRVGDELRLVLDNSALFESIDAAGDVSFACEGGIGVTLSPNLATGESSTVSFAVTGVSSGETTAGATCSFISLQVSSASLTSAGDVSMGGGVFDSAGNTYDAITAASTGSAKVLSIRSQVASISVSTAFNGVVDFQDSLGYGFETDDGSSITGNSDNLTLTVTGRDTLNSFGSPLSLTFAIAAESGKSFAWLCTGNPSTILNSSAATGRVASSSGAATTVNAGCTSISVTDTFSLTAAGTATSSVEFGASSATPSAGLTIEPMTFPTLVATVTQGASSRAVSSALTVGSWTSNGSTVQIPYMPINTTAGSSKIDPVIIISNRSTATGTINATVRDEDGNSCSISDSVLGSIAGGRTKSIGGSIRDAIAGTTCSTLGSVEKVSVTLTITLPSGSTEVYSGYTVGGGDRVTVVNSSNGFRYSP